MNSKILRVNWSWLKEQNHKKKCCVFFVLRPTHQGYQNGILRDPEILYPITLFSCSWWDDDDDDTAPVIVDNGPAATITWEKQIKGYFWLQFFQHTCYHRKVDFERPRDSTLDHIYDDGITKFRNIKMAAWWIKDDKILMSIMSPRKRSKKSKFNHDISPAFCDEITLARARTKRRMGQESWDFLPQYIKSWSLTSDDNLVNNNA